MSSAVPWYLESSGISVTFYKMYSIELLIYFMAISLYPRKNVSQKQVSWSESCIAFQNPLSRS